jgi:hypothetical protein
MSCTPRDKKTRILEATESEIEPTSSLLYILMALNESSSSLEEARDSACNDNQERAMAAILPYVRNPIVFEPEATHAMSVAFDEACRALKLPPSANQAREVIAARIIELARRGERDPFRLRDRVINEAGGANGKDSESA